MRRAFLVAAALALAAGVLAKGNPYGSYLEKKTIAADGVKREYYVHPPAAYDAGREWPLVLVLHGGGGTAAKMNKLSGMNVVADREGFIAVYPQGKGRHWNDGRAVNAGATDDVDDVAFLVAVVERLERDYVVNPKRVYACGISNGAMMSYRLGADRPDIFAAVAGGRGGGYGRPGRRTPPPRADTLYVHQRDRRSVGPVRGRRHQGFRRRTRPGFEQRRRRRVVG